MARSAVRERRSDRLVQVGRAGARPILMIPWVQELGGDFGEIGGPLLIYSFDVRVVILKSHNL